MNPSLLDLFAVHAPKDPQYWFEPVMDPPERPGPQWFKIVEGVKVMITAMEADRIEQASYADSRDRPKIEHNQEQINAWDREYNIQRFKQWPYAFAVEQMRQRQAILKAGHHVVDQMFGI